MKKRNHYELLAASSRADMRSHALAWRANKCDPPASMLMPEQNAESIATNLMCAKSYRDNSISYAKMGAEERAESERKPFPPLSATESIPERHFPHGNLPSTMKEDVEF